MASISEVVRCRNRWLETLASGESVSGLVRDICVTCREAVTQLGYRLIEIGYPKCQFIRAIPNDLESRIARIEQHTGTPLPMVMREFWRVVGGISLIDLDNYQHVSFWDDMEITGRHGFCDGVYVDACDEAWAAFTVNDFSDRLEEGEEDSFRFALAPDGYHKDDISGGAPYELGRNSDWGPIWENFVWAGFRRPETATTGPMDFVSYLRTAILECAGFPGLFGHPRFEELRQKLASDLPPF